MIKCQSYNADKCRVSVDSKGAFDKAHGGVILYELGALGVSGEIRHYLCKRNTNVRYQLCLPNERKFELRTPHGGAKPNFISCFDEQYS